MQINGIEAVELLGSADPAAAAAVRNRGRKPVVERTAAQPLTINGIEGIIFGTSSSGVGSTIRLDSADPALAREARQRGQRAVLVVDSSGAVVPSTPAEAWYEEGTGYDALAAVMDFNNDRYALPTMGSELVTNGGFATDTDWTKGTNWTIASGVASKSAGTASGLTQAVTLTAGKLYSVTYTISALSASTITMQFTGGTTVSGTARSANGTYTDYLTAVTGNTTLSVTATATTVASIDGITVKEIVLTATGRTYGSELIVNGAMVDGAGAGAEIFTNPDMSSGTTGYATFQCTLTTGTGSIIATVDSGMTAAGVSQGEKTVTAAGIYELRIRAKRGTAANWYAQIIRGAGGSYANLASSAVETSTSYTDVVLQVVSPSTDLIPQITINGTAGQTIEIDSMSFKRLDAVVFGWLPKTPLVGTEKVNISGGTLNLTGDGTNGAYADQSFTTVASQVYEFVFTTGATNTVVASVGTSQGGTQLATFTSTAASTQTIKFAATGTTTWLRFSRTAAGLATVDNVSIKNLTALGTYPKREATFDECFAYTAASTTARTYTNVSGVIANDLAVNARRMTYANGKRQLRLENAGTNLQLQSEFASGWGAIGGTRTLGTLVENSANSDHYIYSTNIITAALTTYTFSVVVQRGVGSRNVQLRLTDQTSFANVAIFNYNLDTLAVTTYSVSAPWTAPLGSQGVRSLGGGKYLLNLTATVTNLTSIPNFAVSMQMADGTLAHTYTGDGASSIIFSRPQVEASAFATDYIPTTTASVTRAIETARLSPLLEAVLQRAQASVLVRMRASSSYGLTNSSRLIVGQTASADNARLLGNNYQDNFNTIMYHSGGTVQGVAGLGPRGFNDAAGSGLVMGFDAAGTSVCMNAGTVGSGTALPHSDRSTVYLGRGAGAPATNLNPGYADGWYDLLGISPERLPNTDLPS